MVAVDGVAGVSQENLTEDTKTATQASFAYGMVTGVQVAQSAVVLMQAVATLK